MAIPGELVHPSSESSWGSAVQRFGTVIGNAFGKKKLKYLEKPLDIFPKTEAEEQAEIRETRNDLPDGFIAINIDGRTKDGSVPYIILKNQLDRMR